MRAKPDCNDACERDQLSAALAILERGRHHLGERQPGGWVPVGVEHLWPLLLDTVRYSMGRISTAPSAASGLVRFYAGALEPEQRQQIADEIRDQLERNERRGEYLGHACDHATWRELLEWMGG